MSDDRTTVVQTAGAPSAGRRAPAVLGVVLIAVGVAWLLDTTDIVTLRWATVLPAALLIVGVSLLATARRGAHGGLVAIGIVLSVLVVLGLVGPPVPTLGAVGERDLRPPTAGQVDPEYGLAVGTLTIDLTDVALESGTTRIEAGVGVGELVLHLPEDAAVQVQARSGMGEVEVLGESQGGIGVTVAETVAGPDERQLDLSLSVGLGQIEVRR